MRRCDICGAHTYGDSPVCPDCWDDEEREAWETDRVCEWSVV